MNKLSQIGGVISTSEFQRRKGRASTRWLFYELGYFESIENLLFFEGDSPTLSVILRSFGWNVTFGASLECEVTEL